MLQVCEALMLSPSQFPFFRYAELFLVRWMLEQGNGFPGEASLLNQVLKNVLLCVF